MKLSYDKEDIYSKLDEKKFKKVDEFTANYINFLNRQKLNIFA